MEDEDLTNIKWDGAKQAFIEDTPTRTIETFEQDGRQLELITTIIRRHILSLSNKIDYTSLHKRVWVRYKCEKCGEVCMRDYLPIPKICDVFCGHTCRVDTKTGRCRGCGVLIDPNMTKESE
jgi:hypothetical protein